MAWRGHPTSSWETLEASTWWGSVRVWGEAGGLLGALAFLPAGHQVSAHRDKGAETAHQTLGCCSACSAHRMVASWAPPTPGPLHLLCLLPGALALGPGLSLPPCPHAAFTSAGLLGRPAPSPLATLSPPLLSARQEAPRGLACLFSPWDPERRLLGFVLGCDPVPGADLARGGMVPAPRKSLVLALRAGGAQLLLVGDPCVPTPRPPGSGARQSRLCGGPGRG